MQSANADASRPRTGTPSAFAEFQATTRRTASQATKTLEAGGYLVQQRSRADGRSVTPRLTDKGHQVVVRDPFQVPVRAVGSLKPQEQTAMRDALRRVLTALAASGTRTLACAGTAPISVAKSTPTRRVRADPSLDACCSPPRSSRMTLFCSASIFSQKANSARRVHQGRHKNRYRPRATRKFGQISRPRRRPGRLYGVGGESQINCNTSHQIPVQVIEAPHVSPISDVRHLLPKANIRPTLHRVEN